ncbi:CocE/NonD family hydrolase C-terminal non-catalytic domain-containing protein [Mesorhizobium sp. B2-7-1]|uniref:CocE/NonD family hydrolase C-terminal non-catalytic domain-containing protein n=1 Tax=Mesorhizobium sp. B2-7-1 TaxID=2589909 RepID=UPI001FF00C40|nr:CocE/NonD family hydrolase C-terminal non-catalytic domain-containing protein [Mesorhizobium sp. B2-7-1]
MGVRTFWLNGDGRLAEAPDAGGIKPVISSPLTTGVQGQEWCPYGQGRISAEGARDQRADDGGSLCFDSAMMDTDLPLTGVSKIRLRVAADKPQAQVCVRLTDLAPDGTSSFVTFALLNLTHRDSHEFPVPLTPGRFEELELSLKPVAQVIPAGHRLRVAISSSYWPMAWPSPERTILTFDPSGCRLDLAVLASEEGLVPVAFAEPLWAEPGPVTVKEPARQLRSLTTDLPTERTELTAMSDDGRFILEDTGTEITSWRRKVYGVSGDDPASCATTVTCHEEFTRPDWNARVDCEISFSCDRDNFYARGWVKAYERGAIFAERNYDEVIPRDCM